MSDFLGRLLKVHKHLSKWSKRSGVTCYRLYQRDLNDYPLIIDWYDGNVVVWFFERKKDESDEQKLAFIQAVTHDICAVLNISQKALFIKHRYKLKGLQTQYDKIAELGFKKNIQENGLMFEVNFTDYLDTGLFLDHRNSRHWIRTLSYQKKVLNLFAYTGSFTCYALAGEASLVTTVDLNPNYIAWAKRNVQLNGFDSEKHHFVVQDCRAFLKDTSDTYDIIICDPPTFSNSKRTNEGVWSVDDHYSDLIQHCASKLNPNGHLFFSTNSRSFKLDLSELSSRLLVTEMTSKLIPEDFKHRQIHQSWDIRVLN